MQKLPPCRRDRLTAVDVGTHLMIASNEDINCLSIQPRPWRFRLSSVNDEYHLSRLHSYRNVRFNGDRQPVQCLVDNKQQFRRWHPLRSIGSGDDSLRIASSLYWPRRLHAVWMTWMDSPSTAINWSGTLYLHDGDLPRVFSIVRGISGLRCALARAWIKIITLTLSWIQF